MNNPGFSANWNMEEASKEKNNYLFFNELNKAAGEGSQRKRIFDMADILKISAA